MKILISGGDSKFSKELQLRNTDKNLQLIPLSKNDMDVTNIISIKNSIIKYKPDILLHTAALSRPMSLHNSNPDKSIQINIIGSANCVLACMEYNIKLVYISTDFVYPGINGFYKETDSVYPINKYAWSKLGGECSAMLYSNSLILRMAMIENIFPHKKAFTDSFKSCIWMSDAADITLKLIKNNCFGIFNVGGERKSIYDFVKRKNLHILEESKNNIDENVPSDISMDITKLNSI